MAREFNNMAIKRADAARIRKLEVSSSDRVNIRCRSYKSRLLDVLVIHADSMLAVLDNRGDMAQLFLTSEACFKFFP